MSSGFPRDLVDDLLVACHRRCCICHRVCGVKIETDHIVPKSEGGTDDIANAIAVCFDCHAEIHSYNDKHPRGRKFRPEELRKHKEQWLELCKTKPELLMNGDPKDVQVGPLQALIDELEFNLVICEHGTHAEVGCMFLDDQFRNAVKQGAIATLIEELKRSILEAYRVTGVANQAISAIYVFRPGLNDPKNLASDAVVQARPKLIAARDALLRFLSAES